MTVVLSVLVVVLVMTQALLFLMMGEVFSLLRQSRQEPVEAFRKELGDVNTGSEVQLPKSRLGSRQLQSYEQAGDPSAILILSTSCATCHTLSQGVRDEPHKVEGMAIVIAGATEAEVNGFANRYGLATITPHLYSDVRGEWTTSSIGVGVSPMVVWLSTESGQLTIVGADVVQSVDGIQRRISADKAALEEGL